MTKAVNSSVNSEHFALAEEEGDVVTLMNSAGRNHSQSRYPLRLSVDFTFTNSA